MSKSLVLAIESSCDETAAAVLEGFDVERSHVVFSQAGIHAEFGGVVPEVASRSHLQAGPAVIDETLAKAGVSLSELSAVAATTGPGLATSLLVGVSLAKGLCIGADKPFLAVNHIEGHLLSPFFGSASIPPHIGLVVSGGHTLLIRAGGFGDYRILGRTQDDAAGEAFDKAAKMLGLGYPGGAQIDRLARTGDPTRHPFPRGMRHSGDNDFSFSGLKTSLRVFLEKSPPATESDLCDVCASFQAAVVDVLVEKSCTAAIAENLPLLAVSGGVSANSALAARLRARTAELGLECRFPPPPLLTDNALMIAFAAAHQAATGRISPLTTEIFPSFDTVDWARPAPTATRQPRKA